MCIHINKKINNNQSSTQRE